MSTDKLPEIKSRLAARTPGFWSAADEHGDIPGADNAWCISILHAPDPDNLDLPENYSHDIAEVFGENEQADAELIAAAPELLTWAAERIEELDRKNTNLALRVIEIEAVDNAAADFGKAYFEYLAHLEKRTTKWLEVHNAGGDTQAVMSEMLPDEQRLWQVVLQQHARLGANIDAQQFRQEG